MKQKLPKLTIICPVYNSEKYVGRLIDSLISQDFDDFELIIINDGSKDNSLIILERYAKQDKRIRVVTQDNRGIAEARNRGIRMARGEYIMFADNDDYMLERYLSAYIEVIEKTGADIVMGGYQRRNERGKIIERRKLLAGSDWSKYMVMAPWAKIYSTKFIQNNDLKFLDHSIGEDVYFNMMAYIKTNKINVIDNDDYVWFYNINSVSNGRQKGMRQGMNIEKLLDEIISNVKSKDVLVQYFMRRYIVWFLLYSGKDATSSEFVKRFRELAEWKKKHGLVHTLSPWSRKLKGESFKIRMSVFVLGVVEKTHLEKVFARLYCKGGK